MLRFATVATALAASATAPVVIDAGRPVRVRIVARVPIADDQRIEAAIVDPIYVGNRVVVAAGSTVTGRIETWRGTSTRDTVAAMAGGDLTPPVGARVRFDTLAPVGDAPLRIAAVGAIDVDEPAPRTGEWIKDYLLGQLPYHRRYVHADAMVTMTLIEPVLVLRQAQDERNGTSLVVRQAQDERNGTSLVLRQAQDERNNTATARRSDTPLALSLSKGEPPIPARLLTPLDSATAVVGDRVDLQLLAPARGADGRVTAPEGARVTGHVAAVSRARAFARGGRVTVRLDALQTSLTKRELPIRFIWPPLAALALVSGRDPAAPDASTFFGRAGAGWSGFLVIGAAVAPFAEPVALGLGAWGLVHSTWVNVLRRGRDVTLPAGSVVLLSPSTAGS
ncbi:MAG TPA: hypothetical protein VFA27_01405 [Vicinamibacterales bacterium]|nr:hypothetical protein [Vicinamibacterales bacterium]